MKAKRNRDKKQQKDYKQPSAVLTAATLHPGAGIHQESKEQKNKRTGRLRGAEKRNLRYDE